MDEIKELIEALGNKIKAPIISSIIFSSIAFNWKVVFYIVFAKATPIEKFAYFDMHMSIIKLLIIPAIIGSAFVLISPFLNHFAILLTKNIKTKTKIVQANSKSELLEHNARLERARNSISEIKQEMLFKDAKLDEKIEAEITDTNTKENLKKKIKVVRGTENKKNISEGTATIPNFDFLKKKEVILTSGETKEISKLIVDINNALNDNIFLPPMSFEVKGYGENKNDRVSIGINGINAELDRYTYGPSVIVDRETLLNLFEGLIKFPLVIRNNKLEIYGDISIIQDLELFFEKLNN